VAYPSSVPLRTASAVAVLLAGLTVGASWGPPQVLTAAAPVVSPEQFIGFQVGADNRLARWDTIVEYMQVLAAESDRIRFRELGTSTSGNPFVLLEISAPDTLRNLDRFKQLARRLYHRGGPPTPGELDDIYRHGKVVVLVSGYVHATEIASSQMALELVHRLVTDDSPATRKILDNVIFLLVPSLNPDGQIMVTDWFNQNLGTPFQGSPLPYLYHPYVGHDSNRDMYIFTQKESRLTAELVWHDWFPAIWLDQHQMGPAGPRIFVMPATDPINPNVHPLIYRWNTIIGQSQAAALEAAGKDGIIYNSTYTNFWQGAMAWSGWWHNQIGLLTEVASVRIATPIDQDRVPTAASRAGGLSSLLPSPRAAAGDNPFDGTRLPAPTDVTPRTEYPRPWLGGRWTLRDIIDYELITTMALLETAADRRETILRQIAEVNRQTVEEQPAGEVTAILIPRDGQHDPREAGHLIERLRIGGVEVHEARAPFELDGRQYAAGTFVIPMTQVFARYAKDLLEPQAYPEVRRSPSDPAEAPYDVTAWSLGMLFGLHLDLVRTPLPANLTTTRVTETPAFHGRMAGRGTDYVFQYRGADTAIAINRLLGEGARVALGPGSQVHVSEASASQLERLATQLGLEVSATVAPPNAAPAISIQQPRIGLYAPWTGGNIDEGWTRWVLEQYEFKVTTIHNADIRDGGLRQRFDAIVLADQTPRDIIDGFTALTVRPEYRGGITQAGVEHLHQFVAAGGTLITLGAASDLAIERLPIPVRNLKRTLRREEHFAPGTILRIQVDTTHPIGYGTAAETHGFYNNSPFFGLIDSFTSQKATIVARYPNEKILASGWLKGEELMAGRAAVVSVEMNPGRVILFGLRPQHRAQTHATFPMLFNALYLSTSPAASGRPTTTARVNP
jgi:hypothetical protein